LEVLIVLEGEFVPKKISIRDKEYIYSQSVTMQVKGDYYSVCVICDLVQIHTNKELQSERVVPPVYATAKWVPRSICSGSPCMYDCYTHLCGCEYDESLAKCSSRHRRLTTWRVVSTRLAMKSHHLVLFGEGKARESIQRPD
jgi:hypothetical protein